MNRTHLSFVVPSYSLPAVARRSICAGRLVPVFFSANMSIGATCEYLATEKETDTLFVPLFCCCCCCRCVSAGGRGHKARACVLCGCRITCATGLIKTDDVLSASSNPATNVQRQVIASFSMASFFPIVLADVIAPNLHMRGASAIHAHGQRPRQQH